MKSIKIAELTEIKCKYILTQIFDKLKQNKLLEVIRYNKNLQNILNISINDYKEYSKIIIDIIPCDNKYGNFVNIFNKDFKPFYHIYFNDNIKEIHRNYIKKEDKIYKIKIKLDEQIKSLYGLFKECHCIKEINFLQFNRKDIINMSYMFYDCSSLQELNVINFKTNNVTNMNSMFNRCRSLKNLNLCSFNTNNVTDMNSMFFDCASSNKNEFYVQ